MSDAVEDQKSEVPNIAAELEAMQKVSEAVKGLDRDAVSRVLAWISGAYKLDQFKTPSTLTRNLGSAPTPTLQGGTSTDSVNEFSEANDLYHAANPASDVERALVVGYWFQVCQGQDGFDSQSVNGELKHLGYPVGNITRAFDALQKRKPVLASQTRKSGTSKQARKKYKLTLQGIAAVEKMIAGQGFSEE